MGVHLQQYKVDGSSELCTDDLKLEAAQFILPALKKRSQFFIPILNVLAGYADCEVAPSLNAQHRPSTTVTNQSQETDMTEAKKDNINANLVRQTLPKPCAQRVGESIGDIDAYKSDADFSHAPQPWHATHAHPNASELAAAREQPARPAFRGAARGGAVFNRH